MSLVRKCPPGRPSPMDESKACAAPSFTRVEVKSAGRFSYLVVPVASGVGDWWARVALNQPQRRSIWAEILLHHPRPPASIGVTYARALSRQGRGEE